MVVKALQSPPTSSSASAMAAAERVAVPLNSRCSKKCEAPASCVPIHVAGAAGAHPVRHGDRAHIRRAGLGDQADARWRKDRGLDQRRRRRPRGGRRRRRHRLPAPHRRPHRARGHRARRPTRPRRRPRTTVPHCRRRREPGPASCRGRPGHGPGRPDHDRHVHDRHGRGHRITTASSAIRRTDPGAPPRCPRAPRRGEEGDPCPEGRCRRLALRSVDPGSAHLRRC